jgi:hypothetical protein
MPAKGKVSLIRQTIYCFIPIMDMYAAYHVKKLRWYLLIMLAVGIPLSVAMSAINPMPEADDYDNLFLENQEIDWGYALLGENPEAAIASLIIYHAVAYALAVYLIRRWSKKWNKQFDDVI